MAVSSSASPLHLLSCVIALWQPAGPECGFARKLCLDQARGGEGGIADAQHGYQKRSLRSDTLQQLLGRLAVRSPCSRGQTRDSPYTSIRRRITTSRSRRQGRRRTASAAAHVGRAAAGQPPRSPLRCVLQVLGLVAHSGFCTFR